MPSSPLRKAALLLLLAACSPPTGPTPLVGAVTPDLACDAGAPVPVLVSGSGFGPIPARVLEDPVLTLPTLTLVRGGGVDGVDDGVVVPNIRLDTAEGTLTWIGADTLGFDASPAIGLVPGAWDLTVSNPDAQTAALAAGLVWSSAPELTGVSPASVCNASTEATITLTGGSFLVLAGVGPTLTVAGGDPIATTASDCAPLAGDRDGEVCSTLTATVDTTVLPLGEVQLAVTNPDPAACVTDTPATIHVNLPPEISRIEPGITCSDGAALTIVGDRLPEDAVVTVGGVPAASVTYVDSTTIEVTLGEGTPEGVVDVVVGSADGCEASATVEIVGNPDVFQVEPRTLYTGLTIEVTAWLSDITSEVTGAWLEAEDGTVTDLAFTWDSEEPGRLLATVPAGLAPGSYGFGITEADGCGTVLPDAVTVTDTVTVAIEALDPPFAWTYDDTPVLVLAEDPIPDGSVGFVATPRIYVTPAGGAATAGALRGVDFVSETSLTATVPEGFAPGVYDVLVSNPDGTVGLLSAGLTVTEDPPPTITSVSPPSLPNSTDGEVTVRGTNFRDPTLGLSCEEDGVLRELDGTVLSSTSTSIEATLPSNSLDDAVCVVEVTNSDGTSARWAAISVRNPAENLFPWSAGTEMVVARRAPSSVAGRTTAVARWVYAIGGDDGDPGGALTSVERASIGVYGDLGEWELLPGTLPSARTLAGGAIVGSFVYVVGGDDGAGPVASGWRAHILDPDDVPTLDELSIDDEGALSTGDWVWRVAALYDAADTTNPGGESLPSDPIGVTLPEGEGFAVELTWEPVDRAVGYRVYRSAADDTTGSVEWVGDTTETTFRDDGISTDPTREPHEAGDLGEWSALPEMLSARSAPCVAVAPDPIPDPEIVHLYVAGGLDADPLDSVEVLDIQVVSDDEQLLGTWVDAGVTLTDARYACGAFAVESSRHSVVEDGETWIYVAGGHGTSRTYGTVDTGRVGAGGLLEDWQEIDSMSPARAGFGVASASDFLYGFGGHQGEPSTGGVSGELGVVAMPDVRNWNSLGVSLTAARYLPGSAQESAVIVLTGGETDTEAASRSTDVTNW